MPVAGPWEQAKTTAAIQNSEPTQQILRSMLF
jgi:hypothetical protein